MRKGTTGGQILASHIAAGPQQSSSPQLSSPSPNRKQPPASLGRKRLPRGPKSPDSKPTWGTAPITGAFTAKPVPFPPSKLPLPQPQQEQPPASLHWSFHCKTRPLSAWRAPGEKLLQEARLSGGQVRGGRRAEGLRGVHSSRYR